VEGGGPALLSFAVVVASGASPRARAGVGDGGGERARELAATLRAVFCGAHARAEGEERAALLPPGAAPWLPPSLLAALRLQVPRSGVVALESLAEEAPPPRAAPSEGGHAGASDAEEAALLARLRAFWALRVEVVLVSDDGAAEDAAVLAVTAALQDVALPLGGGRRRRLRLRALPVATTVALLPLPPAGEGARGAAAAARRLLLVDPCASSGEALSPSLTPYLGEGGGGGGGAALLARGGLAAQGLAAAHATIVCDAAGGGALLAVRHLGGSRLAPRELSAAAAAAKARAEGAAAAALRYAAAAARAAGE
jgi:hypothetical protein